MRSNINNLLLGNPTSNFRKIAQNKHQALENMEASQRPSRELYLTVQKTGNFANKEIMYEQYVDDVPQDVMPIPIVQPIKPSPPRELTPIEEKVLEIAINEGNIEDVKTFIKEIQKETPPPPQMIGGTSVSLAPPQMIGGTSVSLGGNDPVLIQRAKDKVEADKIEAQKTLDKLQKEKDLQKKVILYGGIGTGILLLITVVVAVILVRNS